MRIQANRRTESFQATNKKLFETIERMNESIERAILAFADAHARQQKAKLEQARRAAAERAAMILECRSILEVGDDATPAQLRDAFTRKLEVSRDDVCAIVLNSAAAMVLLADMDSSKFGGQVVK